MTDPTETDPAVLAMLADVRMIVEATRFEEHMLWAQFTGGLSSDAASRSRWQQEHGFLISDHAERPTCFSIGFNRIDGHRVMFWHPTSRLVDHGFIEAWMAANLPSVPQSDAMNFYPGALADAVRRAAIVSETPT